MGKYEDNQNEEAYKLTIKKSQFFSKAKVTKLRFKAWESEICCGIFSSH